MSRCPMPGCGKMSPRNSVCDDCLEAEQKAPGTLERKMNSERWIRIQKELTRFVGVLVITVLFLYLVLYGAVKVIKFAGG